MQSAKGSKPKDIPPAPTIRAQAKSDKQNKTKAQPVLPEGERAKLDKSIVKAVLASPLVIPWPSIPTHLQKAVMNTLPSLLPRGIVDYHVDRARCHVKDKRGRRKIRRVEAAGAAIEVDGRIEVEQAGVTKNGIEGEDAVESGVDGVGAVNLLSGVGTKRKTPTTTSLPITTTTADPTSAAENTRPTKPEILNHLVLGINETIKTLEKSINDLKFTLLLMSDSLNNNTPPNQSQVHLRIPKSGLLPTAPTHPSISPVTTLQIQKPNDTQNPLPAQTKNDTDEAPLEWIIVPLLSINPQTLVSPILQYCATYNALVYQYQQLSKTVKARMKESDWEKLGLGRERGEVRVITLGDVEVELAGMVGLRRLACLGVRDSHPSVEVLRKLLPRSILKPPRHSISIPYLIPSSNLTVHTHSHSGHTGTKDRGGFVEKVGYAPLSVKGISTTMPVDNSARKRVRLEEVRRKRKEGKERRKVERKEKEREEGRGLKEELKASGKRKRNVGEGIAEE